MQLRPYQQEMLDAMAANNKGYLTAGTGAGKTFTFITDCRRFLTPGNVIVVVAPQHLLSEQLFNEFDEHLSDADFVYRQVSSDSRTWQRNRNNLKFRIKVQPQSSTTTIDEIEEIYSIAQKAQQPLILFSTYKSLKRVVAANIPVTVAYFDEAHNAADNDSFDAVEDISALANHAYYFTATPRRSESTTGRGFDNSAVYGEHIANIKFGDLVESGSIVEPVLHLQVSNAEKRNLDEISADVDTLMETVNYYETEHYETGAHKILVACRGTANIQGMRLAMIKWANDKGYDLLSVDSVNGGYMNETQISSPNAKGKFLAKLNELGEDLTRKMIVLHYDMLGEGIDVKAFTGTVFMRNICSNIKAVQAMGRVIRSSPGKKYGIVTIIQHGDDTDDAWYCMAGIVNQLLTQGVPVDEIVTEVSGRGKEDEIVEDLTKNLKQRVADYDIQWQHSMMIQDLLSSGDPLDILG
jgi:predicted helicase